MERRLVALVQRVGGMCVKIPAVVAGTPDRLVLLPPGNLYLIETKAPTGRLRPDQRAWHAKAQRVGVEVAVLSSSQEVEDWIQAHTN